MTALTTRRSFAKSALLLMGGLAVLTSCTTTDGPAPATKGKAGYVIGKVTDSQGNPVAKATIFTENTVYKGKGAQTTSGADGTFRIPVVEGLGLWEIRGFLLKDYNKRVYKLSMDLDNTESFTAEEGAVRNFQWKLSGHVPDRSLDLYYGGNVELQRDPNAELNDIQNIEFTLKPVGALIDGSTGKTLKVMGQKPGYYLKDVPIGRYEISAFHKTTGKQLGVRDNSDFDSESYANSVTMDFFGTESADRSNTMVLGYTNR